MHDIIMTIAVSCMLFLGSLFICQYYYSIARRVYPFDCYTIILLCNTELENQLTGHHMDASPACEYNTHTTVSYIANYTQL